MSDEELKARLLMALANSAATPESPLALYQGRPTPIGVERSSMAPLARAVGDIVRSTCLDLERYGYLPAIKNIMIDFPLVVWNPMFQITVEFV